MNQINPDIPKVAVIGSGYWGKNLVRSFHQLRALRLICDKNETLLENLKNQYPELDVCSVLTDVLGRKDIESVVIATPAETHFTLAREALLAGKHVFVEKPLSLTKENGRELVDLAEQQQLTLMVGHILQYHPAVIKLKSLIDSGELGKIQYLYSNRLNIGKIRAEENILWSFAPHDISVILMLLGEMPEAIYATGGSYLQHHIPDTTLTTLDFPSGVKAHIFVSWLHPFKEQKLVVVGDKKMAIFDDVSQEKLLLYPHKIQWLERIPMAARAEAEVVAVDMEEPLKAECRHFSHILSGSRIGEHCNIGQNVVIGPDVKIGNDCKIQNNVSVYKGVTLEDEVFCGPSMVFTNVFNPRCAIPRMRELKPTLVKKGATIGANATIICGHIIGRYAFIGVGAVVTKDVPDYALAVGNPAKINGWVCECGERLSDDLECLLCGKKYKKQKDGIQEKD